MGRMEEGFSGTTIKDTWTITRWGVETGEGDGKNWGGGDGQGWGSGGGEMETTVLEQQ